MSYNEAFVQRYDEWSAHMTDDVAFYADLAREAKGPIVELAVGNGRVAIPIAKATGKKIIGIDSSPNMLAAARKNARVADVELDLREEDMREFTLDEPVELIYCPFRSLLHLPTWKDRRQTFEHVAAALTKGGRFAWNVFVFNAHFAVANDGIHRDKPIPHVIHHSFADNRIDILPDEGSMLQLWWATKNEWLGLIDVSGLELEALYSGFAREPYSDSGGEYVFVTRKP